MLSRDAKRAYYLFAGPMMRLNGWLYRHFRAPRDGTVKAHLGPGRRSYISGWINVDANPFTSSCDLWANLRNPLPFHDSTVDAMYSHHMVEHLPNLAFHFSEVYRCLKAGGVYRVGGPNGDCAVKKFVDNDLEWFDIFPDRRESVGGRLDNFIFCRQEHLALLTNSYVTELMSNCGFTDIRTCLPTKETGYPELFDDCLATEFESDFEYPHTLIVEATKPNHAPGG